MTHLTRPIARSSLFRKYTLVFSSVVGTCLLLSGLSSLYFSYIDRRNVLIELQREQARGAAARIAEYVSDIEQRIAFTSPPKPGTSAMERRRSEIELLGQIPAITEISLLDHNGLERLKVSSTSPDVIDSLTDYSKDTVFSGVVPGKTYHGPIHFFRETEPHMTLAMAVGPKEAGVTVAKVNLEFLLDGISRIKIGRSGHAYVVDARGQLIAHPDLALVLGRTNIANLPQVDAALRQRGGTEVAFVEPIGLDGKPVLSANSTIAALGWTVFADQPEAEAFAPLSASLWRSVAMLVTGVVAAVLASMMLVRKMVTPIQALRQGAMAIGSGQLDQRIDVATGDELEDLAAQFNQMGARLQSSYAELLSARQIAEAASTQKSDFLAMMSHEMRTPLGGVIGMLGLALRDLNVNNRQHIELARKSAQSLLLIINDVLDVSKIEAGKLSLETIDFDLSALTREAAAMLSERALAKGLPIKVELAAGLPNYGLGDPTRIRQVLLNLLGNALKFTDQGVVSLKVRPVSNTADSTLVEFSVADTGPGIPTEALGRLFGKFEQADLSTTRRFGGTGLGLAICKELVEMMGGRIGVKSEVGRGSTFWFELPMTHGQRPTETMDAGARLRHSHALRILCAEDEPTNQIIIRALLEDMGHSVEIADDGHMVLNTLADNDFDLVLMDGRMPYMDGLEATQKIRAGGPSEAPVRWPAIPIIALTADAGRHDEDLYLRAGMDGFLSKPIDERALFVELDKVISLLLSSGHPLVLRNSVLISPTQPATLAH